MAKVAVLLIDRVVNDGTRADVVVMLNPADREVEWARRHGITLAPDARLNGGTNREVAMSALSASGFEVIVVTAHEHLGQDDRITIHQWVPA